MALLNLDSLKARFLVGFASVVKRNDLEQHFLNETRFGEIRWSYQGLVPNIISRPT